ncbi:SLC13 family permease [Alkalilimnicola ehrlichii]|uniref:SLC13 family permease n=1 Tax=Alkalilimnicola ehrlichii TaxID=351052 RepID=UPI0026937BBF|nr:SLC13 family permease [Alkalilimnicola ehrlichii]
MDFHGWLTLFIVFGSVVLMSVSRIGPELILLGAVVLLTTLGILTPEAAVAGFANTGLITVALMFVIVAGIRETGGINFLVTHVLGRPQGRVSAQTRLMLPTLFTSAFLNNTPVVATFIPAVVAWSKRIGVSVSRLLMPLSYAAILGGTCTLIGTSTNLAVNGLLIKETGGPGLGMFDIAWVGIPTAVVGIAYILILGGRLLPDRQGTATSFGDPREYTVEMTVDTNGPLMGKTVEEAGLRHLQGLFLIEIERHGHIIPSVGSSERLEAGDNLVFAGVTESVVELHKIRGLSPSGAPSFSLDDTVPERSLVEVAIAPNSDIVGKTIKEGRFRSVFGASVVAVARDGQRIEGKIGSIRLQPSDTLLLEASPSFLDQHRHSRDFLLISEVPNSELPRYEKAWLSWTILGLVVASATFGWLSMINAAMLGAALMILTGCVTPAVARKSLDTQVLLAIAAAFALGDALYRTGGPNILLYRSCN